MSVLQGGVDTEERCWRLDDYVRLSLFTMSDTKHKMSAGKLKKAAADLKKLFDNVTDSSPTEQLVERRLETLKATLKKFDEDDTKWVVCGAH